MRRASQLACALTLLAACAGSERTPSASDPTAGALGEGEESSERKQGWVRCGIDVLVEESFERLRGRRVAILTSRIGRDHHGVRTIDRFAEAQGVELIRLFSPEHGLESAREGDINDEVDSATGLPIHSLYGERRAPDASELAGIDDLIVDLQDVGVRFYTYATTMGYAMRACGQAGVRVLVLDRPNPIAPAGVQGPIQDPDQLSFIAWQPIPLVHGLTLGELATLYVREFGIECELDVVAMQGWSRTMWYEDTGVPWIDPSPNLRSPMQAQLYPALGLLEACGLSVGRGTEAPFECIGAPWIDSDKLLARLRELDLPGVQFTAKAFTPSASRFEGEPLQGIALRVEQRDAVQAVELGLQIAWALEREFAASFDEENVLRRFGSQGVLDALYEAQDPSVVMDLWQADVRSFSEIAAGCYLYP
ncbi:MAG: hypothetical protein ACI841_003940 [Planctomycetota bacterium]